jgi:hypothetical protein
MTAVPGPDGQGGIRWLQATGYGGAVPGLETVEDKLRRRRENPESPTEM